MYSPSDRRQIRRRTLAFLFSFVFDLLLLSALIVVSICLSNYQNYLYFEIFGGIGVAVFAFFAVFFFSQFRDCRRYLLHIDSVMAEKERCIAAEVVSIGSKDLTLDDSIRVREIVLKQGEDRRLYYVLSAFCPCPIEEGRSYLFVLADRFIKGVNDEL